VSGPPPRIGRHLPSALAYHVLAHLDLGRDAANLFDARLPERPWKPALRAAYEEAPGRLAVQWVGLMVRDLDGLQQRLEGGRTRGLEDEPGRRLAVAFRNALEAEAEAFEAAWHADARAHAARMRALGPWLDPLARAREALWQRAGREPPPLTVLDCPALGRSGRGLPLPKGRVVAVSLTPPDEAACQILHEETHPVSDPKILAEPGRPPRDTRQGTEGASTHKALEEAAVALGTTIVAEKARELAQAWHARIGVRPLE
jgi:hypothetical protein